jgi:hypothetical protein
LKGQGFSRAADAEETARALQAAENLAALKGHDFSRADKPRRMMRALASEGFSSPICPEIPSSLFSPCTIGKSQQAFFRCSFVLFCTDSID